MKKGIVTMTLIATVATALPVSAQESFTAPVPGTRQQFDPAATEDARTAPVRGRARGGDFLQGINPFAPREYGSGAAVVYAEEVPGAEERYGLNDSEDRTHQQVRGRGVRLLSIPIW